MESQRVFASRSAFASYTYAAHLSLSQPHTLGSREEMDGVSVRKLQGEVCIGLLKTSHKMRNVLLEQVLCGVQSYREVSDEVCSAVVACARGVVTLPLLLAFHHPFGFRHLYSWLSSPPYHCTSVREAAALTRNIWAKPFIIRHEEKFLPFDHLAIV